MTQDELNNLYDKLHEDEEDHTEEWQEILAKMGPVQITGHHSNTAESLENVLRNMGCSVLKDPMWDGTSEDSVLVFKPQTVEFTKAEVRAIFDLIDSLSGGNPENIFAWDGTDSLSDPTTSAAVKIYESCGRNVPENLETQ